MIATVQCAYTPEQPGIPRPMRAAFIGVWITFFAVNFSLSWHLMEKYWARFRTYDNSKKADNASRVNSTIHAAVVAPSLLVAMMRMEWGPFFDPLGDPSVFQLILPISMGYFMADMYVLYRYRTPMWNIFMLHHFMACIPYLVYLLCPACSLGVYILASYMLVEMTNLTYNAKLWMEEVGDTQSRLYAVLLYSSAALWVLFRNYLPARSVYLTHTVVIPNAPFGLGCLLPGIICGYFVNAFCAVAFMVVFGKEIAERWQSNEASLLNHKKHDDDLHFVMSTPSISKGCSTESESGGDTSTS